MTDEKASMDSKYLENLVETVTADHAAGKTHPRYTFGIYPESLELPDEQRREFTQSLFEKINSYLTTGHIPQDEELESNLVKMDRWQWGTYFKEVEDLLLDMPLDGDIEKKEHCLPSGEPFDIMVHDYNRDPVFVEKGKELREVFEAYKADSTKRYLDARASLGKLAREIVNGEGYAIGLGTTHVDNGAGFFISILGAQTSELPDMASPSTVKKIINNVGEYHKGFKIVYSNAGPTELI